MTPITKAIVHTFMANTAYEWLQVILSMNTYHMGLHLVFGAKQFSANGTWGLLMYFFHMLFQVEHRSEHFTTMFTWTGFLHVYHFDMGIKSSQSWKNLSAFVTNMCGFNLFGCAFFFVNKFFVQ